MNRQTIADRSRNEMLFNEILTLKVKNKKLEEEIESLKDKILDLQERVDAYEWAMGL